MEFEVSKIGAAVEQLDWAIRLFLDRAYIPAITLAGAAEEVLGGAVVEGRAAHARLKKKLSADYVMTEKAVSEHLNQTRNWLKHWGAPEEAKEARIELDEHALQLIFRALVNLQTLGKTPPAEAPRLHTWLAENRRPALLGDLTARWLRSVAPSLIRRHDR